MKRRIIILIAMLHCIPMLSAQAGNWQDFPVMPSTDDQQAPDVYGETIVWHQLVQEFGDYDVYIADINNPADPNILIIGDANDQMYPVVYEKTIAWQDFIIWGGSADWDIYIVNLSEANPMAYGIANQIITNEQHPALHGSTLIWNTEDGDYSDVQGADITDPDNPILFPIALYDYGQQNPAIYRTTVVWQDNYYGDWVVYSADIWQKNKPEESPVTYYEAQQTNPAIYENTVVWQDDYYGDWDIFAADIKDPTNPVETTIAAIQADQTNPDIDGNIIVWQDNRNGNWDIYAYNLTTRTEFQITDNTADQTNPAINGNVVVWQDNRTGPWNIYAVILDGPQIAQCKTKLQGDLDGDCKVDFRDLAVLAADWLQCGLEPNNICW